MTPTPTPSPLGTGTPFLNPTATATLPAPSCIVRPVLTEGPYFVDAVLNRSDIRTEPSDGSVKEGKILRLVFRVLDVTNSQCAPLAGAQVDIWHCDAEGVYSGVTDPGFNTSALSFLRGYQVTDASGKAEFTTIYPGWYDGRAVHIHFKIRTDPTANQGYEFTSQVFFDDTFTDDVYKDPIYSGRGARTRRNANDGIFQQSEGLLTLNVVPEGEGYTALFDIGLDLNAAPTSGGGQPGRRP